MVGAKFLEIEKFRPLQHRIPSLWKMYSEGGLGTSRVGMKRPASVLEKPLTVEQQRRLDSIMSKCENIRSKIQGKQQAYWYAGHATAW